MARQFLEHVEHQGSVDGLEQCFPFQVLAVTAAPREFYEFYRIEVLPRATSCGQSDP
jgi:hypothetical protein